jgi:pre-60S factor REI1
MRSDWHRYNLKRKMTDLPPLSSEDFNNKVLAAKATTEAAAAQASYLQACAVCRKTYYSEHAYQDHLRSRAHRQREAAAQRGENLSVNGSTVSTGDSQSSEPRDPEAEAEFEEVVAGIKRTSIQEPSPIKRRPSAPSPEAPPKAEHPMSPEKAITTVPLLRCFFCNYDSPTWKLSVSHMGKIHGLFIPEQNYLTNPEGLLGYLQAKILQNYECLWCHKLKSNVDGVQTHMRDKGHCRIAFETEAEMIEVGQYYDFSSTYSDPEQEDSDTEMDEPKAKSGGVKLSNGNTEDDGWETDSSFSSLDSNELTSVPNDDKTRAHGRLHLNRHHSQTDPRPHKNADGFHSHAHHHTNAVFYDESEMHLPSGRVAGHRSLKKYYRQNLHSYPTAAERMARAQRLIEEGSSADEEMEDVESNPPLTPPRSSALMKRGEAGLIGATAAQRRHIEAQEQRSRTKALRSRSRYQARVEKQANSQKHFRVSPYVTANADLILTFCLGSAATVK